MRPFESAFLKFKVAKTFDKNTNRINSIDFSKDGNSLISSSTDDQIVIYNTEKAKRLKDIPIRKYGVELLQFSNSPDIVLHSSNKQNDAIRQLSLVNNHYIRYYVGHTEKVVSLCMSPTSNLFTSGSLDKTVRLWDLRSSGAHGLMENLKDRPVVSFDPEGILFAVGINREYVKMYDLRSWDKGPFTTFPLQQNNQYDWTSLKFSPDGKTMMINANGSEIYILNAFDGKLLQILRGPAADPNDFPLEASFSPDSKYIFSGSSKGSIFCWNVSTGTLRIVFQTDHNAPVRCVKFNPKYMMMVSACATLSFWIPAIVEK